MLLLPLRVGLPRVCLRLIPAVAWVHLPRMHTSFLQLPLPIAYVISCFRSPSGLWAQTSSTLPIGCQSVSSTSCSFLCCLCFLLVFLVVRSFLLLCRGSHASRCAAVCWFGLVVNIGIDMGPLSSLIVPCVLSGFITTVLDHLNPWDTFLSSRCCFPYLAFAPPFFLVLLSCLWSLLLSSLWSRACLFSSHLALA